MNYYEVEFKLKIIKEYLNGPLGGRSLARKYGLPSNALIYNWKHSYQLFGLDGLKAYRSPTKYTSEFKRDVLHFIETTGASFGEAARRFKLPSGSMISRWQRKYIAGGETSLSNLKGRPKKMTKPTLDCVLTPLEKVIEKNKDRNYRMTIHSDQGWHYQNSQYVRQLKQANLFQSMSRKGNCLDNALMENFFGLMKQEMYHRRFFSSFEELKRAVTTYIH